MAIVAIMAGLASAGFSDQLAAYRFHHAVRTLVSDLRGARQLAVTEGRPVRLVLDPDRDRFQIERLSEPGVPVNAMRDLRDRKQGFGAVDLLVTTGPEVVFQSNGITTDWMTITLEGGGGRRKRISVILTGRVKVL